jgi:tartrate dehydrogenase/decarboxylase/D-malate dehydrogenase
MNVYRIATIPGDGIGKEVVPAGRQVLEALARSSDALRVEFANFDWGGDHYRRHGRMMPEDGLDAIRHHDAILSAPPAIRTSPTTSRCGVCG